MVVQPELYQLHWLSACFLAQFVVLVLTVKTRQPEAHNPDILFLCAICSLQIRFYFSVLVEVNHNDCPETLECVLNP